MHLFEKIHQRGTTIVMITHDMDNVIRYADEVVVLSKGRVVKEAKPYELFSDEDLFSDLSIEEPLVITMAKRLNRAGYTLPLEKIKDIDTLAEEIAKEKSAHE